MNISAPMTKAVPKRGGKPLGDLARALLELPVGQCLEISGCDARHTSKIVCLTARRQQMKVKVHRDRADQLTVWKLKNPRVKSLPGAAETPKHLPDPRLDQLARETAVILSITPGLIVASNDRHLAAVTARELFVLLALSLGWTPKAIEIGLGWIRNRARYLAKKAQDRCDTERQFRDRLADLKSKIVNPKS